jgi:hypothetical protein
MLLFRHFSANTKDCQSLVLENIAPPRALTTRAGPLSPLSEPYALTPFDTSSALTVWFGSGTYFAPTLVDDPFPSITDLDLTLDDALNQLAKLNPQQSRIIELRFFGGLSIEETSRATGLAPTTVKKYWAFNLDYRDSPEGAPNLSQNLFKYNNPVN